MLRNTLSAVLSVTFVASVAMADLPARYRQTDASRVLAGVRQYPDNALNGLLELSNQPDVMRQVGEYFQTEPKEGQAAPEPSQTVRDALAKLQNTPEIVLIGLDSPRALDALRELFRQDSGAARERIRELRTAFDQEQQAAAVAWEQALRADPVAAGEFRDLLTRFSQDQLKDMPEFAVIAVTGGDYYNAILPDARFMDFVRQTKSGGSLSGLMDRWAADHQARRSDERAVSSPTSAARLSAETPLYALSASWRQSMWRPAPGGKLDGGLGLVPVILQPPGDLPPDAVMALAIEEHARLWEVGAQSGPAPAQGAAPTAQAPPAVDSGQPLVIRDVDQLPAGQAPAAPADATPEVDERFIYRDSYKGGGSGSFAADRAAHGSSPLHSEENCIMVDDDTEIVFSDDNGDGRIDEDPEVVYVDQNQAIPGYDDGSAIIDPAPPVIYPDAPPVVVYDSPSYGYPGYSGYPTGYGYSGYPYDYGYGYGSGWSFGLGFGSYRSSHSRYYARPIWNPSYQNTVVVGGHRRHGGHSSGTVLDGHRNPRYYGAGGRVSGSVGRVGSHGRSDGHSGGTVIRRGSSDLNRGGLSTVSPLRTTPRPAITGATRGTGVSPRTTFARRDGARITPGNGGRLIAPRSSVGASSGHNTTKRDRVMIRPRSGSSGNHPANISRDRSIRSQPGTRTIRPRSGGRGDATPLISPRGPSIPGGNFGNPTRPTFANRGSESRDRSTAIRPSRAVAGRSPSFAPRSWQGGRSSSAIGSSRSSAPARSHGIGSSRSSFGGGRSHGSIGRSGGGHGGSSGGRSHGKH